MSKATKRPMRVVGKPSPKQRFVFRGVEFRTRTLGAHDEFTNQFVWFASGWTFDGHCGVHSHLIGAIADRFELDKDDELGLWHMEKFCTPEQIANRRALEAEIAEAGGGNG